MQEGIKIRLIENAQAQITAAEVLPDVISCTAMMLVQSLFSGNKILCCGNGTFAANAQHLITSMINRFETERPSLSAIVLNTDNVVLTTTANDRLHDEVYAKQVRVLGHAGDVLLAISTHGNSRDIVEAVEAAVTCNMTTVALIGYDGGELAGLLGLQDVEIRIPSHHSARIQEMHMLTVNYLCDLIGNAFLPHQDVQEEYMKALSPIAIPISALLLQDCVTAAVVGTATMSTKTVVGPRSVNAQADDGTLGVYVNSVLLKDGQIKKEARINVMVYQGKMLLVGQSPNAEFLAYVRQTAMGVDDANEVYNKIRRGQPIGLGEVSSDTRITTKVCPQLLTNDLVKSFSVEVITENGEMFLTGPVTEHEAKAVANTASRVGGVKWITTAPTFIRQQPL